jgi:hypothetical protein
MTIFMTGCKPNLNNSLRTRASSSSSTENVNVGQGYVLLDNPIILSNNSQLSPDADLNKYRSVRSITTNSFLTGSTNCYGLSYCFEVKGYETEATALQTTDGKWGFNTSSSQFLQVNTYYHMSVILKKFITDLDASFGYAYNGSTQRYATALPTGLQKATGNYQFIINSPLTAFADCNYADNAYFNHSTNSLCFGYTLDAPALKWAQDSTVIYHEAGHFLQYLQLNINNYGLLLKGNLGNFNYDEAGSIGEGLSDYFSYYINQRTHFAEWGIGRVLQGSRPMSEDDSLHISTLAKESGKRLSYPDYLGYEPNNPTAPIEDIHVSGMIVSHFLVALTEDLMSKCALTKTEAQSNVMYLLNETLAELGDLNAKGTVSGTAGRINLNASKSYEWLMKVNPINYRSFSQTLAKYLLLTFGNSSLNRCNGTVYTKDNIETIFDDYGLLLFRTYNENRNFADHTVVAKKNTAVTATNRNKSVLIAKDLIKLDPTSNASTAYIIDKRSSIMAGLESMQSLGIESLSKQTPSDLGYNNGNGKISPGEVVGIALNLYNNSNATMGDVQVLANDWKNLDATGKPCIYSSNVANDSDWTTTAEGGGTCGDNSVTTSSEDDFQPICTMQYNGPTSTTWVSQHTFRSKIALDSSYCLDPTNDKNCFMKAIKGADQANYSKLNPKKNWFQTMQDPNDSAAYPLGWGNLMLFEVSKHIPPGTIVDCRFRVRFTNCDDCYHDASRNYYDFTDNDYNGPKPYKIIHLKFTIID